MSNVLSPQEVLRVAIKVEENGKSFYEMLEEKATDVRLRRLWRYLKEEEEAHGRIFLQLLQNIGNYIVPEYAPGEYDDYMKALSSGYVFTQELIAQKTAEGFRDQFEAIDFGIYIEKESILVYSGLKHYVRSEKHHIIDKVIDEERKHLVQLANVKESI